MKTKAKSYETKVTFVDDLTDNAYVNAIMKKIAEDFQKLIEGRGSIEVEHRVERPQR